MNLQKEEIIKKVQSELGSKRTAFLKGVEKDIDAYISNSSIIDCLTIVMRNSSGTITSTWYPKEVFDGYFPRFIAFLKKEHYKDRIVDSYLTDKVVSIVTRHFTQFYNENEEVISKAILEGLLTDQVFINTLCGHIIDTTQATLPSVIQSQLSSMLVHKLEAELSMDIVSTTAHGVSTLTTKVVSGATALPITKTIAMVLMKNCGVAMKGMLAKVLASSAFKTMLAASVKKMVAIKILGILISTVGTKIGAGSVGIALSWIIWPALLAFIAYEVNSLPTKLGKKISVEVCNELSGQYQSVNRAVVSQILLGFAKSGLSSFASDVANDQEIKNMLAGLVAKVG